MFDVSADAPNFFGFMPSSLAICTSALVNLNRRRASNQGCSFGGTCFILTFWRGVTLEEGSIPRATDLACRWFLTRALRRCLTVGALVEIRAASGEARASLLSSLLSHLEKLSIAMAEL